MAERALTEDGPCQLLYAASRSPGTRYAESTLRHRRYDGLLIFGIWRARAASFVTRGEVIWSSKAVHPLMGMVF